MFFRDPTNPQEIALGYYLPICRLLYCFTRSRSIPRIYLLRARGPKHFKQMLPVAVDICASTIAVLSSRMEKRVSGFRRKMFS